MAAAYRAPDLLYGPGTGPNGEGRSSWASALRARNEGVNRAVAAGSSIADFLREFPGFLDPASDRLLGRHQPHQFQLLVLLAHGGGELFGISVFKFTHGIDSNLRKQFRIALAETLDPKLVRKICEAQQPSGLDPGPACKILAAFQALRRVQELAGGADAGGLQPLDRIGPQPVQIFQ